MASATRFCETAMGFRNSSSNTSPTDTGRRWLSMALYLSELQLVGLNAQGICNSLPGGFAWPRRRFLLCVGRLGDAETLSHIRLGQAQMFTPGTYSRSAVDHAADHIVGNQILIEATLGDVVLVGNDHKRRLAVRAVDDLYASRFVHRVSLPPGRRQP